MRPTSTILAVAFAIGLTASCAHTPRLPADDPETSQRRAQYLREHPVGPHNPAIMRGEIKKGMAIGEVVAAWGIPERRVAKRSTGEERWTYTARDPHSADYVSYELVFVESVLKQWYLDRNTTGSGVRWKENTPTLEAPLLPGSDGFHGDAAPKKNNG